MLDKAKARLIKDQIKSHIQDHRTAYWAGSLVVIAGATYIVTRRFGVQTISVAPVFNNMPTFNNDNSSLVNFGGHMTKMVERASDGKIWKTVTEAAEANNAPLSLMSRHLNGHKPNVYGEAFKIVGVGTTG